MWRHYSSRIWLVVPQHSHWRCIAQQIFTKSSFQLCKGVSLLHLYQLGVGQDESDRRTGLLLHCCLLIFLAYWYFTCLAPSLQGKTTKGKAHPEMQIPNILISRTRTISTLQISKKIENYPLFLSLCEAGEKKKKEKRTLTSAAVEFIAVLLQSVIKNVFFTDWSQQKCSSRDIPGEQLFKQWWCWTLALPVKGSSAFRQTFCMPFVLYTFSLLTCSVNFPDRAIMVSPKYHTPPCIPSFFLFKAFVFQQNISI